MYRAILFLAILFPALASSQTVITFPDPDFEAAVRERISKPTGDILDTDVQGLNSFTANNKGISDLSGLEHFTGLTTLVLNN